MRANPDAGKTGSAVYYVDIVLENAYVISELRMFGTVEFLEMPNKLEDSVQLGKQSVPHLTLNSYHHYME